MAEETLLAKIGGTRSPILIKLRAWKGMRFLDVRRYFTQDGELKPTRKGIGLRNHAFQTLRAILQKEGNEIEGYLLGEEGFDEWATSKRYSEESAIVDELKFGRRALKYEVRDHGRGPFFSLRSSGDEDTVTLNAEHPFVAAGGLRSNEPAEAVTAVLAAYARAKDLLATDEEEARLFAELEHHWSLILARHAEGMDG